MVIAGQGIEPATDTPQAAISDVSSGDMDGSDTVSEVTLETALNAHETAINSIILALENVGILIPN